jgi:hypothetical protein
MTFTLNEGRVFGPFAVLCCLSRHGRLRASCVASVSSTGYGSTSKRGEEIFEAAHAITVLDINTIVVHDPQFIAEAA